MTPYYSIPVKYKTAMLSMRKVPTDVGINVWGYDILAEEIL